MIKKCVGCGIELQSKNIGGVGYVHFEHYDKSSLCVRCFRLNNYNDYKMLESPINNEDILEVINEKSKLTFFMCDFLNINEEVMETFKKITTKKYFVINKFDMIPKSIKKNSIVKCLELEYRLEEKVIFTSSKNNYGITSIVNTMDLDKVSSAYLVGYTNAGKSSLINRINLKYNQTRGKITTSILPNTTLDFIKIKLDELSIIDSPGFVLSTSFCNDELLKVINPKKEIKPRTHQVKDKSSIIIEDILRLESNDINSWTFYLSDEIGLDKVYDKNERLKSENVLDVTLKENSDLVFKGLGFVNIKNACTIRVYGKLSNIIEVRGSVFRK